MKCNLFPWLAILMILLLSWWLRILYIEPQELAISCESGVDDFACSMRKNLTAIFYDNVVGFAVLAMALTGLWRRSAVIGLSAALLGMAGMVIHGGLHTGVEFNTVGFVLAVLSLPRFYLQPALSSRSESL